ncbi:60S ribosomal protein L31 [Lemmus lemmus]
MAPAKKGGENKKSHSAINQVVTQEYTINIHRCVHGVDFKKRAPREMGASDVWIDTRLNKAIRAKGIRNVPYCIWVRWSRKHNEDEVSPNKLYTQTLRLFVLSQDPHSLKKRDKRKKEEKSPNARKWYLR